METLESIKIREFSFDPLFKLLTDRNLKHKELAEMAGISLVTVARLRRGENVKFDILVRICRGLGCGLSDIVNF